MSYVEWTQWVARLIFIHFFLFISVTCPNLNILFKFFSVHNKKGSILRALRTPFGKFHNYNYGWIHFDDIPLLWKDNTNTACSIGTWPSGFIRHMGYEPQQQIYGYGKFKNDDEILPQLVGNCDRFSCFLANSSAFHQQSVVYSTQSITIRWAAVLHSLWIPQLKNAIFLKTFNCSLQFHRPRIRRVHAKLSWESLFAAAYHTKSNSKIILEFLMAWNGPARFARSNQYNTTANRIANRSVCRALTRWHNHTGTFGYCPTVQSNRFTCWPIRTVHFQSSRWIPDERLVQIVLLLWLQQLSAGFPTFNSARCVQWNHLQGIRREIVPFIDKFLAWTELRPIG